VECHSDFAEQTPEEIEQQLSINLLAPMLLTRLLLPGMLARAQGTIINMSSMCVRYDM
jgi:short-subunit dehydrogenase